jgi:hypothetical protein
LQEGKSEAPERHRYPGGFCGNSTQKGGISPTHHPCATASGAYSSVDPLDVLAVYPAGTDGKYTHCVLVLIGGTEIADAVANDALAELEALVNDPALSDQAIEGERADQSDEQRGRRSSRHY